RVRRIAIDLAIVGYATLDLRRPLQNGIAGGEYSRACGGGTNGRLGGPCADPEGLMASPASLRARGREDRGTGSVAVRGSARKPTPTSRPHAHAATCARHRYPVSRYLRDPRDGVTAAPGKLVDAPGRSDHVDQDRQGHPCQVDPRGRELPRLYGESTCRKSG